MDIRGNFIVTTDKETADKLIKNGVILIGCNGQVYTFINNAQIFSNDIVQKITYTNVLCM
nr:MAG TPA: hypothetical protein [Caudoviricetes sp.]